MDYSSFIVAILMRYDHIELNINLQSHDRVRYRPRCKLIEEWYYVECQDL